MLCCWEGFSPGKSRVPRIESLEAASVTPEQTAKLRDFRRSLPAGHGDVPDYDLLRFLRARKWDVSAALQQFEETLQWRQQHHIDDFRAKAPGPFEDVQDPQLFCDGMECFPQLRLVKPREDEGAWLYYGMTVTAGFDKEGRPIHLQQAGVASQRFAAMYSFAGKDPTYKIIYDGYVRAQESQAARMQESSARLGRRVTQQVVIMDFKGLSFWPDPRALAVFKDFLSVSQRYYPETLGIQFFLNTPPVFLAIWRLIKEWIDPVTASKMHLLGSDFQRELLEYIPADQLPVAYGGTNSWDVFNWPPDIDEFRRRYAQYAEAAERLPGRSQVYKPQDRKAKTTVLSDATQNRSLTPTWAVFVLLLSMIAAFVRVM
ncbi:unnamed protein product [Effrenium voratum]|nr:unnamed protein product [Effrenium voratum]